MNNENIFFTFQIKSISEPETEEKGFFVEGYATTSDIDRENERIDASIHQKIAKQLLNKPLLLGHDQEKVIGVIKETRALKEKTWIRAFITSIEKDTITKIKEGLYRFFSIGFQSVKEKVKGVWTIKDIDVFEVSLVPVPANPQAALLNWYEKNFIEKNKNQTIKEELKMYENNNGDIKEIEDIEEVFNENQQLKLQMKEMSMRLNALNSERKNMAIQILTDSWIKKGLLAPALTEYVTDSLQTKSLNEITDMIVESKEIPMGDLMKQFGKSKDQKLSEDPDLNGLRSPFPVKTFDDKASYEVK